MGELSYTVGGDSNLVSFKSAARVPITSLKAHFKPKQDLHGYSRPWPAGGGKNLFDASSVIQRNGYTLDDNGNEMTYSYCGYTQSFTKVDPETTYTFTGIVTPYAGDDVNYRLYYFDENKVFISRTDKINSYSGVSAKYTFTTPVGCEYLAFQYFFNSVDFSTIQIEKGSAATSYEPYENICPIEGWNSTSITRTGKNIAHIFKYSTTTLRTPTSAANISNSWGTTISTLSYSLPDTPLIVTQVPPDKDYTSTAIYANGYFCIGLDNLIFGKRYDISFKITNITSNPLNKSLNQLYIADPYGARSNAYQIIGDTLIFRNIPFSQNINAPKEYDITIYNNGMSFTLSEFMVTEAKTNDGIFEPYCGEVIPVTFPITGKNLYDVEHDNITNNMYINSSNEIVENQYWAISDYIEVLPSTSYTLSAAMKNTDGSIYMCQYDMNKELVKERMKAPYTANKTVLSFTTESNCKYIRFCGAKVYGGSSYSELFNTFQLELGNTATTYEPYSSNNTFYGGYIDPAAGEAVVEYILMEKPWGEWTLHSHLTSSKLDVKRATFDKPIYMHGEIKWYGKCNMTEPVWAWTEYAAPHYYYTDVANDYVVYMWLPFDTDESTVVQLAARLREPIRYPISKLELITFLNANTAWSNTNDITEVSYAIHDTALIRAAKYHIAANEPHVETIENSLAHFETDMIAPLKKCNVYFSPKQNLNGYNEPWGGNVDNDLFDSNNIIQDYYIMGGASDANRTTGEIYVSQSNWSCTDYIQVEPNTIYTITIPGPMNATAAGMAYYESNNTASVISGVSAYQQGKNNYTFTTPSNCNYLRFSWPYMYGNDCHLVKGSLPYKNICPITGWTSFQIHSAGKNLLRLPVMTRTNAGITWTVHEDGSIDVDGTCQTELTWMSNWNNNTQHKTFYLKAGTYKLSGNNNKIAAIYFVARDGSTNKDIGTLNKYNTSSTFTLAQDTLVGFQVAVAQVDGEIHTTFRPQLEWIEYSDYESPHYSTMDVNWTNSTGTIYGGYIDLLTGEIWETTEIASANWGDIKTGSAVQPTGYYQGTLTFNNRIKTLHSSNLYGTSTISNVFNKVMWNLGDTTPEHYFGGNDGDHGMVYLFGNYDNNTPIQIAAELETPQLVGTLSLTQLKSLKGINNIWSDANGNVEVSYWTH